MTAQPLETFAPATGPVGKIRGLGVTILLCIVTLFIYPLYWYYKTSAEMKAHTGQGLGGPIALLIAIFAGFASPFVSAHEVGQLYTRTGAERPVSGYTGLWIILPLVGVVIWYVKVNGALNDYWRSAGATA